MKPDKRMQNIRMILSDVDGVLPMGHHLRQSGASNRSRFMCVMAWGLSFGKKQVTGSEF